MPESNHQSYVLRFWHEDTTSPWRVTVIDIAHPDQQKHFANRDALIAFLREQAPGLEECHSSDPIAQNTSTVSQMEGNEKQ